MHDLIKKPDEFTITTFKNLSNCRVTGQINFSEWLLKIKNGDFAEEINLARNDDSQKDFIKVNKVPCVTINFNYNNYKNSKNCSSATGLLYIDIDAPDFDISIIDKSLVRAYYKSFGNKGYGIVVKVDGLTSDNFESTYFSICDKLGISQYVDLGAKKASQFNVMSFDTDLFDNPNSRIFSSFSTPLLENNRRERRAYSTEWGVTNVRFSNRQDYIKGDDEYFVDFGNIEIIEAKLLYKKVSKNRNNILLAYCTNLLFLNPQIYYDRLYKIMRAVNENNFTNPVDDNQLNRILNSVIGYHNSGELIPIPQKKKGSIIFSEKVKNKYTKEEKFAIVRKLNCENTAKKTKLKLENIIKNWDYSLHGKITQVNIVRNHPISKKTVEKYYKFFIEIIKISNSKFGS